MPAKDIFHNKVRRALEKEGWTITEDPYRLKWELTTLYVDLAAEKAIAAEKDNQKIAVEIKSFVGKSEMADLEQAIGQYFLYRWIMDMQEPERVLFLAVPESVLSAAF